MESIMKHVQPIQLDKKQFGMKIKSHNKGQLTTVLLGKAETKCLQYQPFTLNLILIIK